MKHAVIKPFPGKDFGYYNLILNLEDINIKKDETIPFYVRIFTNKSIFKKKSKLMNSIPLMNKLLKDLGKKKAVEEHYKYLKKIKKNITHIGAQILNIS